MILYWIRENSKSSDNQGEVCIKSLKLILVSFCLLSFSLEGMIRSLKLSAARVTDRGPFHQKRGIRSQFVFQDINDYVKYLDGQLDSLDNDVERLKVLSDDQEKVIEDILLSNKRLEQLIAQ